MFLEITIDESEKWDSVVKTFRNYDVSYLSGYSKAFQICEENEPVLFYYNDGNTKAINVILKRDIGKNEKFKGELEVNKWFDISTPYGYGGFLVEGESLEEVSKAYESYCFENNIISEFVRFGLLNTNKNVFTGKIESKTHNIVRDLTIPLEEILYNFKNKVRGSIRKAKRSGLKIEIDEDGSRIDEFLSVYYGTMDRKNAKLEYYFPKSFFDKINQMKGYFTYIHVIYEEKIISSELILHGNKNCYSFLGGTNSAYFSLKPNHFLKYEIIKWAKERGFNNFILGGGYGSDDSLYKYKESFAPNGIYEFFIGKKIFDNNRYKELVKIRKKDLNYDDKSKYFPLYRA